MKRILPLLFIFFYTHISYSQIPNGSWRDHLAYTQGNRIAISPEKVYCAMRTGGMLSYDKESGEIVKHSKVYGLSDVNISAICYIEGHKLLVVGYQNGNIDLVSNDEIYNIDDIERKSITTSKRINEIKVYNNLCYLACDFGIVVLDIAKREIKDSYIFGDNGTYIKVNDLSLGIGNIYAATNKGLYKVALDAPNLLDYNYWTTIEDAPGLTNIFLQVEYFENKLIVVHSDTADGQSHLSLYSNSQWSNALYFPDKIINDLSVHNNNLCVTGEYNTYFYNKNLQAFYVFNLNKGRQSLMDSDGMVYSAGYDHGFNYRTSTQNSQMHIIQVEDPQLNNSGMIYTKGDHVWVGSGGPKNPWIGHAAYQFYNEQWRSYVSGFVKELKDVGNIYKMAFNPANDNHIYATGFQYGVYEFEDFKVKKVHTRENNTFLQNEIKPNVDIRIQGLDFDNNNNLWMVFDLHKQPLFVLRNGTDWERVNVSNPIFETEESYADLLVTKNNQIWILTSRHGIVVIRENDNGTFEHVNFTLRNDDNVLITAAYCLSEDNDGNIWVGTNDGPLVYSAYSNIFESDNIVGYQIKRAKGDGTDAADQLLDFETVTDIAIDGGNRKWLATSRSGVFLVSADGKETIHKFNVSTPNSKMLSNNVISVGVHEKTGEVFFSTSNGLISYMSNATVGNSDFENVYVYPNPVRPDFNGEITISGLIADANVKITDISGNIVHETTSYGGQAVWDGKNFEGDRVNTGVYTVFMTNDDGSKTYVTKLVFIH